jgi:CheY-like chemotaxis protein
MYQPSIPTILVVEPNPSLGAIIREVLKNTYRIFVTSDPAQAFAYLFRGNIPNLIILDVKEEQIEFQELLLELEQNQFFCNIPLVLLGETSLVQREDPDSICYRISKPFNPQKILEYSTEILQPSEHQP